MKKFYASLAALLAVVSTVIALNFGTNQSQAAWNGDDCSSNAIIKCGVDSRSELKNKVNNSSELRSLYNHFGVSSSMISSGNVKEAVVHKNGNVTVDGKVVATDAWSVGRESRGGTEQTFKVGNKTYWKRPTTNPNIFRSGAMTAYAFFDGKGNYVSTIIKSCGNPVFAKAKPKPQPPKPKPAYSCASLSRIKQDDGVSYIFRGKSKASNGAEYKGFTFNFGDGSKAKYVAVQRTSDNGKYGYADAKHTYTKSGTFNVKVVAHFTVNGKEVTHTQSNCAKPVTISIKPAPKPKPKPAAECVDLKVTRVGDNKFRLDAKASVKNGATIKAYSFNIKNLPAKPGTPGIDPIYFYKSVNTNKTTASVTTGTLSTLKPGNTYLAYVSVNTSEGYKTGEQCQARISIPAKPKPQPKNPDVSIDKQVRSNNDGMSVEEALEQARNFRPKGTCATVMTPAVHVESGAKFTFNSSCLPNGWVAERAYNGQVGNNANWVEHTKVSIDKPFEYRLVIKNTGDVTLKNAKVSDPAPAGITFTAADKGTIKDNVWTYTIPELKVGQSVTVIITAKTAKFGLPVEKPIKNTACVDAKEIPGTKDDCDDATVEIEKPAPVEVCDLTTNKIVTITEKELRDNPDRYTRDLDKCKEEDKPTLVEVCDLEKMVITKVTEQQLRDNPERYTRDLSLCDVPEEPTKVEVCDPETGDIITVDEDEADNYLPVDAQECQPQVKGDDDTPEVIPSTGPAQIIGGLIGSSALGLGLTGYIRSRRAISGLLQ